MNRWNALSKMRIYVRKTAAVCVAHLHDISPDLVKDRGFLDLLRDLVADANPPWWRTRLRPSVKSPTKTKGSDDVMGMSSAKLQKLLAALNECTEWGQVADTDALAKYVPEEAKDAERIIARVMPRLQHANRLWCCPRSRSSCSTCTRLWTRSRSCVWVPEEALAALGDDGTMRRPLFARGASMASPRRLKPRRAPSGSQRRHGSKNAGQHRRARALLRGVAECELDRAARSKNTRK